jgi:hypothetical protein
MDLMGTLTFFMWSVGWAVRAMSLSLSSSQVGGGYGVGVDAAALACEFAIDADLLELDHEGVARQGVFDVERYGDGVGTMGEPLHFGADSDGVDGPGTDGIAGEDV